MGFPRGGPTFFVRSVGFVPPNDSAFASSFAKIRRDLLFSDKLLFFR